MRCTGCRGHNPADLGVLWLGALGGMFENATPVHRQTTRSEPANTPEGVKRACEHLGLDGAGVRSTNSRSAVHSPSQPVVGALGRVGGAEEDDEHVYDAAAVAVGRSERCHSG